MGAKKNPNGLSKSDHQNYLFAAFDMFVYLFVLVDFSTSPSLF